MARHIITKHNVFKKQLQSQIYTHNGTDTSSYEYKVREQYAKLRPSITMPSIRHHVNTNYNDVQSINEEEFELEYQAFIEKLKAEKEAKLQLDNSEININEKEPE